MINITKTFLPPLKEYVGYLERVWQTGQVTNNGALLRELEQRLKEYFDVKHLFFVANGTLGLQLALRALGIRRKVITTPFSYVATTGALLWEYCTPVFVDIDPKTLCIDPQLVAAAVDEETDAILAVHVYGYPCDVQALGEIASRRGIRLIYDAAHAFGTRLHDRALATWGDVSVLSFHATKLFHTIEGGAVITDSDEWAQRVRLHRAFGHIGEEHLTLGINAKNSELHAAMGLCMLPRIDQLIAQRRLQSALYSRLLDGSPYQRPHPQTDGLEYNHAYYPVIFPSEHALLSTRIALERAGIVPRRYFHPALNRLPYRAGEPCPVAEDVAARALCLPLSHEITESMQHRIVGILKSVIAR